MKKNTIIKPIVLSCLFFLTIYFNSGNECSNAIIATMEVNSISEERLSENDITIEEGEVTKEFDESTLDDEEDNSDEGESDEQNDELEEPNQEPCDDNENQAVLEHEQDSENDESDEEYEEYKEYEEYEETNLGDENSEENLDSFEYDPEAFLNSYLLFKADTHLDSLEDMIDVEDGDGSQEGTSSTMQKSYDNVALMCRASSLTKGNSVVTKGYYSKNDGGGAEYEISDSPGVAYETLKNGLYANLIIHDDVNIKQLGAAGDGTKDDSKAFERALKAGISNIVVPEGTYNLYKKEIKIPEGVSIKGVGAEQSGLINVNFYARYGLKLSGLYCKGGAPRTIWTSEEASTASIMLYVSPVGMHSIEYTDCAFSDVDFVSFASGEKGSFDSDIVRNCTFTNIIRCPLYHSVDSNYTSYTNNVFSCIGKKTIKTGPVAAIWCGDITTAFNYQSAYAEIMDNTFENLYTAGEFDENVKHEINANFIAIRADKAVISGNTIKNLVGYGHDREAVYTKVKNLTISDNYIENGGCGEAYICNKGQAGDLSVTISNNTLVGDFGCGIISYGTAVIKDNSINISHCKAAIITGKRDDQTGNWPLEICGNSIVCSASKPYYASKHTITDYSSGNVIKVLMPINSVKIANNTISPESDYQSYIAVINAEKDITVSGNILDLSKYSGKAISIYENQDSKASTTQSVSIENNDITIKSGEKAIAVSFAKANTKRSISLKNNNFIIVRKGSKSYALTCMNSQSGKDTLEITGNNSNINKSDMIILYNLKNLNNSNESFATIKKQN